MAYSLAEKLFANKKFTKVIEVYGIGVEFRTLSAQEEEDVVRSLNAGTFLELLQARKIPTLARAIKALDGVEWKDFEEIKQRLRSDSGLSLAQAVEAELRTPEKYPDEVVAALYAAHTDFVVEYRSTLEDLKKNSAPPNPVTAG